MQRNYRQGNGYGRPAVARRGRYGFDLLLVLAATTVTLAALFSNHISFILAGG